MKLQQQIKQNNLLYYYDIFFYLFYEGENVYKCTLKSPH